MRFLTFFFVFVAPRVAKLTKNTNSAEFPFQFSSGSRVRVRQLRGYDRPHAREWASSSQWQAVPIGIVLASIAGRSAHVGKTDVAALQQLCTAKVGDSSVTLYTPCKLHTASIALTQNGAFHALGYDALAKCAPRHTPCEHIGTVAGHQLSCWESDTAGKADTASTLLEGHSNSSCPAILTNRHHPTETCCAGARRQDVRRAGELGHELALFRHVQGLSVRRP